MKAIKYELSTSKGSLSNIAHMSARAPGPRYKCWRDHGQISAGPSVSAAARTRQTRAENLDE